MAKYLRVKATGHIFGYDDMLAENPAVEVVDEFEAFPERSRPKHNKRRRRTKALAGLITKDIPEPPEVDDTPPELAAEAARGWP